MASSHTAPGSQSGYDLTKQPSSFFGYGSVKPPLFFQKVLNNAKAFVVLLALANIIQGITINGLLKVNVTTIEKRFHLLSSESGLIISTYDVAGCLFLLPVSYLGGKSHRPRWIGFGLVFTSIGILMLSMPHFISETYVYTSGVQTGENSCFNSTVLDLNDDANCERDSTDMKYVFMFGQFLIGAGSTPLSALSLTFLDDSVDPNFYPLFLGVYYMGALIGPALGFVIGGKLLEIYTVIGVTPTDITVESPQWVGAWWIGFLICGILMFFVSIPILGYPKKLPSTITRKPTTAELTDYTISGSVLESNKLVRRQNLTEVFNLTEISENDNQNGDPVAEGEVEKMIDSGCPSENSIFSARNAAEKIISEENSNQEEKQSAKQSRPEKISSEEQDVKLPSTPSRAKPGLQNGVSKVSKKSVQIENETLTCETIEKFFRSLRVVLTNKAFMCLSAAAASLGILVSGFGTFGPKFIESQFAKSSSEAANIFGYIFIPAGTVGLVGGAIVMSGLKLLHRKALQMCIIVSILGLFVQFAMALHCKDVSVAGVNTRYKASFTNASLPKSLISSCNQECFCPNRTFDPVCGSDGITYYSSCFAACHSSGSSLNSTFANCSCITSGYSTDGVVNATSSRGVAAVGKCAVPCQWLSVILVALFIVGMTTFMCAIPGADLSLRCFPHEYRSLSVGVQWILIRTIGTIPGPLLFGAVIDSTCSLWNRSNPCSSSGRSCALYQNRKLAIGFLTVSVVYKGCSILFFVGAFLTYVPHILMAESRSASPTNSRRPSNGRVADEIAS